MSSALSVNLVAVRRFAVRAQGLETPFATLTAALDHLGYVQIDPIDICGRMHDLILRNRVAGYREGDLTKYLHRKRRRAFEHHHPETHILAAFPLEAWPHLVSAMRERARRSNAWSGRLTPRERELAPRLLEEIAARGPMSSEDFADARRAHRPVWGAASLVKSTLQKLFFHGRLLIAQRVNNRRRYDLPDRVLPAALVAQAAAPAEDTARWLVELKLRQRRLALLKREELRIASDLVQPVVVTGAPSPTLYCLKADTPLLEACATEADQASGARKRSPSSQRVTSSLVRDLGTVVRLIAPLDPLIYDRRITSALWNFDYTWEVYTPPAKRVRGYYALPVLAGTELVGHVEPRADRRAGKLRVASRSIRRGYAASDAVSQLADWLGVRDA